MSSYIDLSGNEYRGHKEKTDITQALGITEERFDTLFDKVKKSFDASNNSDEFLDALKKIPKTKNEGILLGTIFEKIQAKMQAFKDEDEPEKDEDKAKTIYLKQIPCKAGTPKGKREYRMSGIKDSPVGTLDRWKGFAEPKGLKVVVLKEVN